MQSKIFLGTLLFIILFVATGIVLLNEGILPEQQEIPGQSGTGTGRMQIEQRAILGGSTEQGALLYLGNCSTCHGRNGEGVPGKGPMLNPDLFTKHFEQIKAMGGFGGTVKDFIRLTVAAGRPIESAWAVEQGGFPQRMPTWGQAYGGPLTSQQVEDIVNFVMGWQADAGAVQAIEFDAAGSDVDKELPAGDAARGEQLFAQQVKQASGVNASCTACHSLQPGVVGTGPSLAGIATRAETRVAGEAAAQYIRQSIQQPNAFVVPDDPKFKQANGKSAMPEGLGNLMSEQDLADLIAYLLTLK